MNLTKFLQNLKHNGNPLRDRERKQSQNITQPIYQTLLSRYSGSEFPFSLGQEQILHDFKNIRNCRKICSVVLLSFNVNKPEKVLWTIAKYYYYYPFSNMLSREYFTWGKKEI